MGPKAVAMVAAVIDWLEGVQWRELRATAGRASGATLRCRLSAWDGTAPLRRVHIVLIRMVRAGPEPASWDVVVDR